MRLWIYWPTDLLHGDEHLVAEHVRVHGEYTFGDAFGGNGEADVAGGARALVESGQLVEGFWSEREAVQHADRVAIGSDVVH